MSYTGTQDKVGYNIFDGERGAVGQTEQSPSNGTLVQVYDADTNIRTDYVSAPNGALARIKRIAGVDEVSFVHADRCIFCKAKIARLGTGRVGTAWGGAQEWDNEDN